MRAIRQRTSQLGGWAILRALSWCCRWWAVFLLLFALALVAWSVVTRATQQSVATELAAIKARGEPLTIAELAPRVPAGATNAADSYDLAFGSLPPDVEGQLDRLMGDPAFARGFCADYAAVFELLREAGGADVCAIARDWNASFYTLTFPEYAKMRTAARMLVVRSNLLAGEGKGDAALDDIRTAFTLGVHVQSDPTMISSLVGVAIFGMGFAALEGCLAKSDPSPAACRKLFDQLGSADMRTPFQRAVLGERAWGIQLFDDVRGGRVSIADLVAAGTDAQPTPASRTLFAVHRSIGIPWLNLDELGYLERMDGTIKAVALPWPKSHQELESLDRAEIGGLITALLLPGLERANYSVNQAAARIAVARTAVAIKAYRAERGRYPRSLDEGKAAGWPVPDDPLNGKPLHYRHTSNTFTVWSVGPNMKDDNATEWDSKTMDTYTGAYDITLICDLSRAKRKDAEHLNAWKSAQEAAEQDRIEAERRSRSPRSFRDGRWGAGRGRAYSPARSQ